MDDQAHESPYRVFSRTEWAALRADTPLTLTHAELDELRSLNDRINLDEVVTIYLPLSRLLNLYVRATQKLFSATQRFLSTDGGKVPYIVGMAGSVAVGKSTTARILQRLLARWPNTPKVDLVTTDGFILPNAVLEREGLMNRKGFPESYDLPLLLRFLSDIKAGMHAVEAPVYSHLTYDVVADERVVVDRPDILIVEGLNVLQTGRPPRDGMAIPSSPTFSISRSISMPRTTSCAPGISTASSRCARPPSRIRAPISTAMPSCRTRKPAAPRRGSGRRSTW